VHDGDTASDAANAAPHGAPAISGVDGASTADVEPAPHHDGVPGCRGARRRHVTGRWRQPTTATAVDRAFRKARATWQWC